MAPKTLFVVPGTWELTPGITYNTPVGMLKGVTDRINRNIFDVVFVNYPARFGPIAGNGEPPLSQLGSPSYADSVAMGVEEVVRLIKALPAGRKYGIIGYSQGGAIAAQVGRELLTDPTLATRKADCYWLHTFGAPHRPIGKTFHNGNNWLQWGGISGDPIGGFQAPGLPSTLDWFDYCLPKDMFGDANPESYCTAGYQAVADMSLTDPIGWAQSVMAALNNGEIGEAANDLATNPILFAQKAANTAWCVDQHIQSNAHTRYGIDNIIPGWTAIAHSANHLNYWGARR
ncbi:lysin B [Gordonia phage Rahul]|nr:lysin B [Gordonia phage Rahul]